MRNQGEPSVEEILESIKKVIARDNRETGAAGLTARNEAVPAAPDDDSDDDEHLTEPDDEVLDLGREDELLEGGEPPHPASDRDGLTNETSARSMRESLAALAMISEPSAKPQIVRSGETSLEGLVREMLRPMLAQWLDDNLPDMVERLVKAEIARIAHKHP